jgi:hypothetical protein
MTDEEKRAIELFCEKLFLQLGTTKLAQAMVNNNLSAQDWKTAFPNADAKQIGLYKKYAQDYLKSPTLQQKGVQHLREMGTELVDVASDKQATRGYRALDAIARVLNCSFERQTCVAVCIDPRYQNKLLIASNAGTLDSAKVAEFLEAQVNQPALEALSEQDQAQLSQLSEIRSGAPNFDRARYTELRNRRDKMKLQTALSNLLSSCRSTVIVVKSKEDNVHAELQLLDYIESEIYRMGGAGKTTPLYIGVSLRCCAKCDAVFSAYNACGFNHVQVQFRGSHPTADFGGWRCPASIVELVKSTNPEFGKIAKAVQLAQKTARPGHAMTADLSDSEEEEYVRH